MNAIPTLYNGTQFRSRLEARWAAMFDLLGWAWEYEPLDLRGYIPDFLLMFPHRPLLVEVKPALSIAGLQPFTEKVDGSGWAHEAMIVGAAIPEAEHWPQYSVAGILRDSGSWGEGAFQVCAKCGKRSLWHTLMSFHCRHSGCYAGDHYVMPFDDVTQFWRAAGNRVQWKRPV